MVFNSPAKAYRTFSSRLGKASGRNGFERLNDYFGKVRLKGGSQTEWDFQDRLDSGKFFYYPGEVSQTSNRRTCFENSAHLLMAARELYPRSNPRMVYVDEGKRGTHAVVLFEHRKELWGGDISYDFMSPVHINGKRLMHGTQGKGVKFSSLTMATPREVAKVIDNLRGPKGCENYFSDGGQKVLENPFAFRPYSVFMSYENGRFVSDMRFNDFDIRNNTAIRRKYDLNWDKFNVDILAYRSEDWARLTKSHRICWNPEPSKIGGGVMMNQFCSVGDLKDWKIDDFVKQFGSYHHTLDTIAKARRKSKKRMFFFSNKTRRDYLKIFNEDYQKYLMSLPEGYREHVLDFYAYKYCNEVLKLITKKESPKSWKDVTDRRKNMYTGSFCAALRDMSKREAKVHRTLDQKVLKILKGQETL